MNWTTEGGYLTFLRGCSIQEGGRIARVRYVGYAVNHANFCKDMSSHLDYMGARLYCQNKKAAHFANVC